MWNNRGYLNIPILKDVQPEISKTKDFRYPPVLPILFYDGVENWTAVVRLHEGVLLSDVLGEYIPEYLQKVLKDVQETRRVAREVISFE